MKNLLSPENSSEPTAKEALEDLIALRENHGFMLEEDIEQRATALVNVLVETGFWPKTNMQGCPAKKMWEGYGPYWNEYGGPLSYPHCDANLRNIEAGPPYKREIGVEANDRVVHWKCPDCSGEWPR